MKRRAFLTALAALPALAGTRHLQGQIRSPPDVPYDWLTRYQVVYRPANQGPTGGCWAGSANAAMLAVSLNVQNAPLPPLSWPFNYYVDTQDPTFTAGSFGSREASLRQLIGSCRDELYPEARVLANWRGGFPYPAEELPSPACYAEAPNYRLTEFVYLAIGTRFGYPPDMALIRQLVLAGYPVTLSFGRHSVCLLMVYAPDYYWYAGVDSLLADVDGYGLGLGARPFTADGIYNDGWDICVYLEVSGGVAFPACPPGRVCIANSLPMTKRRR